MVDAPVKIEQGSGEFGRFNSESCKLSALGEKQTEKEDMAWLRELLPVKGRSQNHRKRLD